MVASARVVINFESGKKDAQRDSAELLKTLEALGKKTAALSTSAALQPHVDMSELHQLNDLLDIKQQHILETARLAASNPIVIRTRYEDAGAAPQQPQPLKTASAPLVSGESLDKLGESIRTALTDGLSGLDGGGGGLTDILLAPLQALGGLGSQIGGGLLFGLTQTISAKLGGGISTSIERQLSPLIGSTELLGEKAADALGNALNSGIVSVVDSVSPLTKIIQRQIDDIDDKKLRAKLQAIFDNALQIPQQAGELFTQSLGGAETVRTRALAVRGEAQQQARPRLEGAREQAAVEFRSSLERLSEIRDARPATTEADLEGAREIVARRNERVKQLNDSLLLLEGEGNDLAAIEKAVAEQNAVVAEIEQRLASQDPSTLTNEEFADFDRLSKFVVDQRETLRDISNAVEASANQDDFVEIISALTDQSSAEANRISEFVKEQTQSLEKFQADLGAAEVSAANAKAVLESFFRVREKTFVEIAQSVLGDDIDLDALPDLKVDDALLKSRGANALFNPARNAITVSTELFEAVQNNSLTPAQAKTIAEELGHYQDLQGGNFAGLESAFTKQLTSSSGAAIDLTIDEFAILIDELARYEDGVRDIEESGKRRAQQAVNKFVQKSEQKAQRNAAADAVKQLRVVDANIAAAEADLDQALTVAEASGGQGGEALQSYAATLTKISEISAGMRQQIVSKAFEGDLDQGSQSQLEGTSKQLQLKLLEIREGIRDQLKREQDAIAKVDVAKSLDGLSQTFGGDVTETIRAANDLNDRLNTAIQTAGSTDGLKNAGRIKQVATQKIDAVNDFFISMGQLLEKVATESAGNISEDQISTITKVVKAKFDALADAVGQIENIVEDQVKKLSGSTVAAVPATSALQTTGNSKALTTGQQPINIAQRAGQLARKGVDIGEEIINSPLAKALGAGISNATEATGRFASVLYKGAELVESVALDFVPMGRTAKAIGKQIAVPTVLAAGAAQLPGGAQLLGVLQDTISSAAGPLIQNVGADLLAQTGAAIQSYVPGFLQSTATNAAANFFEAGTLTVRTLVAEGATVLIGGKVVEQAIQAPFKLAAAANERRTNTAPALPPGRPEPLQLGSAEPISIPLNLAVEKEKLLVEVGPTKDEPKKLAADVNIQTLKTSGGDSQPGGRLDKAVESTKNAAQKVAQDGADFVEQVSGNVLDEARKLETAFNRLYDAFEGAISSGQYEEAASYQRGLVEQGEKIKARIGGLRSQVGASDKKQVDAIGGGIATRQQLAESKQVPAFEPRKLANDIAKKAGEGARVVVDTAVAADELAKKALEEAQKIEESFSALYQRFQQALREGDYGDAKKYQQGLKDFATKAKGQIDQTISGLKEAGAGSDVRSQLGGLKGRLTRKQNLANAVDVNFTVEADDFSLDSLSDVAKASSKAFDELSDVFNGAIARLANIEKQARTLDTIKSAATSDRAKAVGRDLAVNTAGFALSKVGGELGGVGALGGDLVGALSARLALTFSDSIKEAFSRLDGTPAFEAAGQLEKSSLVLQEASKTFLGAAEDLRQNLSSDLFGFAVGNAAGAASPIPLTGAAVATGVVPQLRKAQDSLRERFTPRNASIDDGFAFDSLSGDAGNVVRKLGSAAQEKVDQLLANIDRLVERVKAAGTDEFTSQNADVTATLRQLQRVVDRATDKNAGDVDRNFEAEADALNQRIQNVIDGYNKRIEQYGKQVDEAVNQVDQRESARFETANKQVNKNLDELEQARRDSELRVARNRTFEIQKQQQELEKRGVAESPRQLAVNLDPNVDDEISNVSTGLLDNVKNFFKELDGNIDGAVRKRFGRLNKDVEKVAGTLETSAVTSTEAGDTRQAAAQSGSASRLRSAQQQISNISLKDAFSTSDLRALDAAEKEINDIYEALGRPLPNLGGAVEVEAAKAKKSLQGIARVGASLVGAFAFSQVADQIREIGRAAIVSFADFDTAIRTFGVVTQATEEQLAGVRKEVERLSITTTKTPQEIADAAVEMGKLGFTAAQTEGALGGVIKSSEATGESLEETATVVGAALNQFGLLNGTTEDIQRNSIRTADLLTAASNASATGTADLGDSLTYVGSTAAAANQSLDETIKVLALAGKVGLVGSVAGTGFANAIRRIDLASAASTTGFKELADSAGGPAVAAFEKINASIRNADGSLIPFSDALEQVRAGIADFSEGDQSLLLNALFQEQGGNFVKNILAIPEEGRKQIENEFAAVGGLSDRASEQLTAGLGGALKLLQSSAGTAQQKLGEFAAKGVEPAVRAATGLINAFLSIPEPIRTAALTSGLLTTAIGGLVTAATAYQLVVKSAIVTKALETAQDIVSTGIKAGVTSAINLQTAAATRYAAVSRFLRKEIALSAVVDGIYQGGLKAKLIATNLLKLAQAKLATATAGGLLPTLARAGASLAATATAATASAGAMLAAAAPALALGGAIASIGFVVNTFQSIRGGAEKTEEGIRLVDQATKDLDNTIRNLKGAGAELAADGGGLIPQSLIDKSREELNGVQKLADNIRGGINSITSKVGIKTTTAAEERGTNKVVKANELSDKASSVEVRNFEFIGRAAKASAEEREAYNKSIETTIQALRNAEKPTAAIAAQQDAQIVRLQRQKDAINETAKAQVAAGNISAPSLTVDELVGARDVAAGQALAIEEQSNRNIIALQLKGKISKEEIEKEKLKATQARIAAELAAEQALLNALNEKGPEKDAEAEAKRLAAIKESEGKISTLTTQSLETRLQAQQQQGQRALDQVAKQTDERLRTISDAEAGAQLQLARQEEQGLIDKEGVERRKAELTANRIDAEINAEKNRIAQLQEQGPLNDPDQEKGRLDQIAESQRKITQLETEGIKQRSEARAAALEADLAKATDAQDKAVKAATKAEREKNLEIALLLDQGAITAEQAEARKAEASQAGINAQLEAERARLAALDGRGVEATADLEKRRQDLIAESQDKIIGLVDQRVQRQEEIEQKLVEAIKSAQEDALAIVEDASKERELLIQRQVNAARAAGKSEQEIANIRADGDLQSQKEALDAKLAAEKQFLAELEALPQANTPEAAKQREESIRAARRETSQVVLDLLKLEEEQQKRVAELALQQIADRRTALEEQSSIVNAANDQRSTIISAQTRLLESQQALEENGIQRQIDGAKTEAERAKLGVELEQTRQQNLEERLVLEREAFELAQAKALLDAQIAIAEREIALEEAVLNGETEKQIALKQKLLDLEKERLGTIQNAQGLEQQAFANEQTLKEQQAADAIAAAQKQAKEAEKKASEAGKDGGTSGSRTTRSRTIRGGSTGGLDPARAARGGLSAEDFLKKNQGFSFQRGATDSRSKPLSEFDKFGEAISKPLKVLETPSSQLLGAAGELRRAAEFLLGPNDAATFTNTLGGAQGADDKLKVEREIAAKREAGQAQALGTPKLSQVPGNIVELEAVAQKNKLQADSADDSASAIGLLTTSLESLKTAADDVSTSFGNVPEVKTLFTGGPLGSGQVSAIAERGPELVTSRAGAVLVQTPGIFKASHDSYVHNAADTARILRQGETVNASTMTNAMHQPVSVAGISKTMVQTNSPGAINVNTGGAIESLLMEVIFQQRQSQQLLGKIKDSNLIAADGAQRTAAGIPEIPKILNGATQREFYQLMDKMRRGGLI
jgi:hypothetical protein